MEPLFRSDSSNLTQQLRLAGQAHQAGRLDEAITAYLQVLQCWPHDSDVHNNLGAALRAAGRIDAAVAHHRRALMLKPEISYLHANLGNALRDAEQPGEALRHLQRAVSLAPTQADSHFNLGLCLRDLGRLSEASQVLGRALELAPDAARITMELGATRLAAGDWRGFADWEARRALLPPPEFRQPPWRGESLAGKRLLLYPEQGLSDVLMFVRYARALKQQGATVHVLCQAALRDLLLQCPEVDRVVAEGEPLPGFDLHCPFASLPHLLGIDRAGLAVDPYLQAPKSSRLRLARVDVASLALGVYWSVGAQRPAERRRSVPLADVLALAGDCRLALFGLQGGLRQQDIAQAGAQGLVHDVGGAIFDFAEAAAALVQLDLLLTVDAPLAHLAGGLGVPAWLLLPTATDWRWGDDAHRTPWYPSIRLYRQTIPGDWSGPLERVRQDLDQLAERAVRHARS
jgi:Flp pilus assembly protein TadD